MTKILTDKKLIHKFLSRGVEEIYPSRELLYKRLLQGKKMKIYQGFDPTGPFLHIGHAIGIRALSVMQQLGHEVIFLVGDFTAQIGDPDQQDTRKLLSEELIKKNTHSWKEQAGQLIDFNNFSNPVRFEFNSKWLQKLNLKKIIDLMSTVTLQRIIERDLFKRRIEKENPIKLHEILYPLMQGYDGVAMNVDMEIGGSDQTFNMLMGRTLMKKYRHKEKFVRANTMMEAPDGLTMSKSKGNGINLSDNAQEIYGKAMSYSDDLIIKGLKLLTDVPLEDIQKIEKGIVSGMNPMQFKKLMAFEIVKLIKGEKQAIRAEQEFTRVFKEKKYPKKIPTVTLQNYQYKIIDLLIVTRLVSSKSKAKKLIEGGGIRLNHQKVNNFREVIKIQDGMILQKGKRIFMKLYHNKT